MDNDFIEAIPFSRSPLDTIIDNSHLIFFTLELTARCNNNCRHCYINLPSEDKQAQQKEISFVQIKDVVDKAVSLGALWCLITGGEPLLREDFFDIYLYLKKKGLLVSIFTNTTLITDKHIKLFKKYPPYNIEVTVYGVTQETYERVTRKVGSFSAFMRGLNLLLENGIDVRLKAMALRSNVCELFQIADFCRERTKDFFRFDPFLHLRFDGNPERNQEIKSERLSAKEIVYIEQEDAERFYALKNNCDKLINHKFCSTNCNHLFGCGAGNKSFVLGYDGSLRLCSSLCHPDCVYDLKNGTLFDAFKNFIPKIRDMRSNSEDFLKKCHKCSLINLCLWCPAHSYLETGIMDVPIDYFCEVAHSRAEFLNKAVLQDASK